MQFPLFQGDIRLEFPDMGDVFVCPDGFVEVKKSPFPEHDVTKQKIILDSPIQDENGDWHCVYKIIDLTEEELIIQAEFLAQAQPEQIQNNGAPIADHENG